MRTGETWAVLEILASTYGPYGPSSCLLYAPGAVCISNMVLEHI